MSLLNAFKGFLIGIALVIPGLSGSIFAVIVGLYEPLISAINQLRKHPRSQMQFLTPIGISAVLGILFSTKVVLWLSSQFPVPAYAFFLGLVLGILPFVWRKMRRVAFSPIYLLITVLGFASILGLTQLGAGQSESYVQIQALNSWQDAFSMLFAGGFSVALMLIPGISGSILLMVISQYGTVYHAVGQFTDLIRHTLSGNLSAAGSDLKTVALMGPFLIGALLGTLLVARLMRYLLARFEGQVYFGVLGVILAAAVILWQNGVATGLAAASQPLWHSILWIGAMALIGILATLFLDQPSETK